MTEIAMTEGGFVMLSAGIDEIMFAKTKFSLLMTEEGFLLELDSEGNVKGFAPWTFSGTKSRGEDVFFCGEGFSGRTVSSLLWRNCEAENEDARTELKKLLASVCAAYAAALERRVMLPCNGPGGILYECGCDGGTRLLFLPEKIFDRACANLGRERYAAMQDCWRDSIAERRKAKEFACAVFAYFALAGALAYPPQDGADGNNQTICDRNFLPIEFCVNGIDAALACAIDAALKGVPLKEPFPIESLRKELFSGGRRIPVIPEEEFRRSAEAFLARQSAKVARRKRFRKHFAKGAAAAAVAVFAAVISASIIYESGKKPTVIGLDSAAVTEIFYAGLHKMDTDFMLSAAKDCPEAQRYISQVPQIFVAAQMRGAFNFESGISTPENWMFFEPDSARSYSHLIYGITNFSLDGKPSMLDAVPPTRRAHPPKLTRSGTRRLARASSAEHTVRYYLVHTVDELIHAEEFTTRVELKWAGDRWQIERLNQTSITETIHPAVFSRALKESLSAHGNDVVAASQNLRSQYPWIPTAASLESERARLDSIGY